MAVLVKYPVFLTQLVSVLTAYERYFEVFAYSRTQFGEGLLIGVNVTSASIVTSILYYTLRSGRQTTCEKKKAIHNLEYQSQKQKAVIVYYFDQRPPASLPLCPTFTVMMRAWGNTSLAKIPARRQMGKQGESRPFIYGYELSYSCSLLPPTSFIYQQNHFHTLLFTISSHNSCHTVTAYQNI